MKDFAGKFLCEFSMIFATEAEIKRTPIRNTTIFNEFRLK